MPCWADNDGPGFISSFLPNSVRAADFAGVEIETKLLGEEVCN